MGVREALRENGSTVTWREPSMGLFRKSGILMAVTSPKWSLMVVTAPGHRPRYPLRTNAKPWIPERIPPDFVSDGNLTKLNLFSGRKPDKT